MARYIDDILQPGETVLYSTNAHWIFHLPGIICWIIAAGFLAATRLVLNETAVMLFLALAAVTALIALFLTLRAWFHRWTTETDVTNLRVVHKQGFIRRTTIEMSLDKIASVNVFQSIPGRIFNYGDVVITSMGDTREKLKKIASPLDFRNKITAR